MNLLNIKHELFFVFLFVCCCFFLFLFLFFEGMKTQLLIYHEVRHTLFGMVFWPESTTDYRS